MQLHPESALDHEKQLILILMVMPVERAGELREFDFRFVYVAPVVGDQYSENTGECGINVILVENQAETSEIRK